MQLQSVDFRFSISKFSKRFSYAFAPQIFRTTIFNDPSLPSRIYPTSWLDGLRGLAAVCVFNFHYVFAYSDMTFMPWGDAQHRWLIELPIIRLPYLGLPMVSIFFIVAGYVISLKPLQLMNSNTSASREKLLQNLCSSVFRRFFRLYLPTIASTLIAVFATRLYLNEIVRDPLANKEIFPGRREKHLPRFETLSQQMRFWYREMSKLASVYDGWKPFYPIHDQHLWTIQYEFRSSLVLYLSLMLVARTRMYVRLGLLLTLSFYAFCWDRWEIMLYLWGSCLAQWDVIGEPLPGAPDILPYDTDKNLIEDGGVATESPRSASCTPNLARVRSALGIPLNIASYIFALWLLTSPQKGFQTAYGYQTLSLLIPSFWTRKEKFLPALGSALLVFLLSRESPASLLRRALTGHLVQYLGKISFSLYLVHGPILHAYGYLVPIWVWTLVGRESVWGYCVGLAVGWVVNLMVVLWLADVFGREVDERCVRAAKWIEGVCFVK